MERKGTEHIPKDQRVIIFANAPLPSEKFIRKYLGNDAFIVCADGGANRIVAMDIHPDLIIGDLDSVTQNTLNTLSEVAIIRKPDQDSTDLQKALEFVEHRGAHTVVIFGATGGRSDHFLGNISLLLLFNKRLSIEIIDERCTIRLVDTYLTLTGTPGQIVSLVPFSGAAAGITTTGLKYPLRNETLSQSTRGISNEFSEHEATVTVREGNLLAIIHHPKNT